MISPYVRRLRLAAELRALRAERGLTHEQLAQRIGQSRAQISRLENGHVVDQDDVMRILDALDVNGDRWVKIMTVAREAGERGWWESIRAMDGRQALYANLEAGAKTIREYQLTFIPGLLQTPEFTRALLDAARLQDHVTSTAERAASQARAGRQRMLRRPNGPTYELILDEVAVRRRTAPPEILKAQLYHVAATVNGNPNFEVRVLPLDATIDGYRVPRTAFSMYTFPDRDDPNVIVVDTETDDYLLTDLTDAAEVARYDALYEALLKASMPPDESLEYLLKSAKDATA